ncbi:NotI family restriction endonuclease [Paraburkholderia silvatlantica]|uniref:NotI family restriction endonuclease n=1 Tax=Paraburkholderia silvatlantica TaxID=321895 RepID=UPI003753CB13
MARQPRDITPKFGIGEWFGNSLVELSAEERRAYAKDQLEDKKQRESHACPFQARKQGALCSKDGGVCSLRLYTYAEHPETGRAQGKPVEGVQGGLRATCPNRFHENLEVFRWVGETILGDDDPLLVGEVGFLEAGATTDTDGGDDVGRIDMVLVSQKAVDGAPMEWCALEIQAVYFSGDAMRGEFKAFADPNVDWIVFPAGRRRPDYRSSGPKRLMPQLQIKVPTLRRWGRKMAVVVDRAFFDSIGEMDDVADISNADIAWFIVKFEEIPGTKQTKLVRDEVRYTTLERSVEGLTGGKPVSLKVFQDRILAQEKKQKRKQKIGRPSPETDTDGEGADLFSSEPSSD